MVVVHEHERRSPTVESSLAEVAAPGALCSSPGLRSACEYTLARAGKGLRPRLVELAARYGPRAPDLTAAAVAVELLHTATLVHDDIVDGDTVRRGAASVWAAFGESTAAYAGAWLLARATELVCSYSDRALELFAGAAQRLLRGQVEELCDRQVLAASTDRYREVVTRKTAGMFAFAAELGATLAGADAATVARLHDFGHEFGIAFQVADDIVDFEQALDHGSIAKARSALYGLPLIYALDARPELAQRLAGADDAAALGDVCAAVLEAGGVELARRERERYRTRARAAVDGLGDARELVELVDQILTPT